jgi:hypothetical protein
MGNVLAMALADEELDISLENAISIHLTSNHYPAVPVSMVQPCIEAIDLVNSGEGDSFVFLPEGITYMGEVYAPAYAIVQQHHLGYWIVESELD